MIYAKSLPAGVAALIVAALIIYALAVGVPLVMELIPSRKGGIGTYVIGPWIPIWSVAVGALLVFSAGFYWTFRRARRQH